MEIFVKTSDKLYIGIVAQRHFCSILVSAECGLLLEAYLKEFDQLSRRERQEGLAEPISNL